MRPLLFVAYIVFISGCAALAPTDVVITGVPKSALSETHPVQVFITDGPERGLQEIAVVEVRSNRLSQSIDWAKYEARRLGADALVLVSSTQELRTVESVTDTTLSANDIQGRPQGTVRVRDRDQSTSSRNVYRFRVGLLLTP